MEDVWLLLVYVVVHIVSRGFGFSKAVFLKLLSRVCSLRRSDIEVILTP